MCGILGAMPSHSEEVFSHALHSLTHRGPDGYGIWHSQDGSISLGHRRLSILDLSDNGKQPLFYDRYVITYNGEVFNFTEIREELFQRGHRFVSDSDTEVVLAAYMEWGVNCLNKLNGMWALGIWDKKKKELFLARDRFGIKPLYYAILKDKFVFASEMKAIFPFLPQLSVSDDFEFCKNNMFSYEATDKCLVSGIKRFPAGHYAIIVNQKLNTLRPVRWWNTLETIQEVPQDYESQIERFRELFFDSIKLRMRSDVRVGTALSGGVDSSAVICAMANINQANDKRVQADWQNAFCATFPNTPLDESRYAKKVADHIGITAVFNEIDASKGIEKLENYLWLFEELYATSPIPMMDIYRTIKKNGVTVTLDGHGADELLSGYGTKIFDAVKDAPMNLAKIQNIVQTYVDVLSGNNDPGLLSKMKTYRKAYKNVLVRYRDLIMTKGRHRTKQGKGALDYFNQYLYAEFHENVLPTLLRNYDRYSMSAGVEIRMPFMDHRLVSYCFSLPWYSKMNQGYTKSILRNAMDPYVPKDVLWRKDKIGFQTPITNWMRGPWKEYLLDLVNSLDFLQSGLVEPSHLKVKVESYLTNNEKDPTQATKIWNLLTPYLWERSVLKGYQRPINR